MVVVAVLVPMGVTGAACGSGSTSPTTVPPKPIHRSGTGSATVSKVTLPNKWTVTWHFDCTHPVAPGRFELVATQQGGSPGTVTDQTGLGGGGSKAYADGGTFTFSITTPCTWSLVAGPSPPKGATTTTTAALPGTSTTHPTGNSLS